MLINTNYPMCLTGRCARDQGLVSKAPQASVSRTQSQGQEGGA